jgi:3-oxoacyl-[acyl-carrier-protein] synthase-3
VNQNTDALHTRLDARLLDIAHYLPEGRLSNDELAELYPEWSAEKILTKTGIAQRPIAAADETAADLAFEAARKLFAQGKIRASDVDFIILCTQAPDFILPTSACILQDRLGIPKHAGALDINLGCSGFVYSLSVAKGLIETGAARCVLLLTADTYSKYIHPYDKSVRTLFGDAAAATAIVAREAAAGDMSIGPFVFGTDGSGARNLMVEAGGFRRPRDAGSAQEHTDDSGNVRTSGHLYMNGAEIMTFSLREVPKAVDSLLNKAGRSRDDIDLFVLHQANKFMLETLRKRLKLPEEKVPVHVEDCGNTVSSTIPLTLIALRDSGRLAEGTQAMLVGFGVGYSWAACLIKF